jgi:glutathione S-transferase
MTAAFVTAPEGAEMLSEFLGLACWWQSIAARPSLLATETGLPTRD